MNTSPGITRWILAAALGSTAGCAAHARVTVQQPYLSGAQGDLHLSSTWAFFDVAGDVRVLLSFPLPGARHGEPFYDVYLRCPALNGHYMVSAEGHRELEGFFQQVRGRHAGTAPFERATLRISGNRSRCSGQVQAHCRDGTILKGDFFAELDPRRLQDFEQRYGIRDAEVGTGADRP